jgi:hypothetical protein
MKKGARKQAKASRKVRRGMTNAGSKIRESDEARTLLERQLHSLYWWVFNASKMKGFLRAKAIDASQRVVEANSETQALQDGSGGAHISTQKQAL